MFVSDLKSFFEYKYCVVRLLEEGTHYFDYWGLGVNRIADLRVHEITKQTKNLKQIVIKDTWNTSNQIDVYVFNVRFTIFDPMYMDGDEMWLEHAGNSNYYFDRIPMKRAKTSQNWLHGKFGEQVLLWYCDMKIYYNRNNCTQFG